MKQTINKVKEIVAIAKIKLAETRGGDWYTSDAARAVIAVALAVVIIAGVTGLITGVVFPALGERLLAMFGA
ncbi:MAG: hypothetical protein PHX51_06635 [Clostridia bacterium]|nr:hypothetical protein [Clostridia bacterium]